MPVYEYKGVSYDIATDDPAEAKRKILAHIEKTTETPVQQLGRSAASLADSAINTLYGTVDQLAYPFARVLTPAEEAQAKTTSPRDIVGRAFGVTGTPSYEGAPLRRLGTAIGETVQEKVIEPVAQATGLPPQDVGSIAGTLSAGAGSVAGPAISRGAQLAGRGLYSGEVAVTRGAQATAAATADAARQVGRGIVSASKPEPQASAAISPDALKTARTSGAIGPVTEAAVGFKGMRAPLPGRAIESGVEDVIRGYTSPVRGLASGALDVAGLLGLGVPIASAARGAGTLATLAARKVKPIPGAKDFAQVDKNIYGGGSNPPTARSVTGTLTFDTKTGDYSRASVKPTKPAGPAAVAPTLDELYDQVKSTGLTPDNQRSTMIATHTQAIKDKLKQEQNLTIDNAAAKKQAITEVDQYLQARRTEELKQRQEQQRQQQEQQRQQQEQQRREFEASPEGQAIARRRGILADAEQQDPQFTDYLNVGGMNNRRAQALADDQALEKIMLEYQQRKSAPAPKIDLEKRQKIMDLINARRATPDEAPPAPAAPVPSPVANAPEAVAPAAPAAPVPDKMAQLRADLRKTESLKTDAERAAEAADIAASEKLREERSRARAPGREAKREAAEGIKGAVTSRNKQLVVDQGLLRDTFGDQIDIDQLPNIKNMSLKDGRRALEQAIASQLKDKKKIKRIKSVNDDAYLQMIEQNPLASASEILDAYIDAKTKFAVKMGVKKDSARKIIEQEFDRTQEIARIQQNIDEFNKTQSGQKSREQAQQQEKSREQQFQEDVEYAKRNYKNDDESASERADDMYYDLQQREKIQGRDLDYYRRVIEQADKQRQAPAAASAPPGVIEMKIAAGEKIELGTVKNPVTKEQADKAIFGARLSGNDFRVMYRDPENSDIVRGQGYVKDSDSEIEITVRTKPSAEHDYREIQQTVNGETTLETWYPGRQDHLIKQTTRPAGISAGSYVMRKETKEYSPGRDDKLRSETVFNENTTQKIFYPGRKDYVVEESITDTGTYQTYKNHPDEVYSRTFDNTGRLIKEMRYDNLEDDLPQANDYHEPS